MIVESSLIARRVIAGWVQDAGAEVVYACGDAQSAIVAFDKVDVDILLLNPDLAGNSGIELLQEKQSYTDLQSTPVILMVQSPAVYESHTTALQQLGVNLIIDRHTLSAASVNRALHHIQHSLQELG